MDCPRDAHRPSLAHTLRCGYGRMWTVQSPRGLVISHPLPEMDQDEHCGDGYCPLKYMSLHQFPPSPPSDPGPVPPFSPIPSSSSSPSPTVSSTNPPHQFVLQSPPPPPPPSRSVTLAVHHAVLPPASPTVFPRSLFLQSFLRYLPHPPSLPPVSPPVPPRFHGFP